VGFIGERKRGCAGWVLRGVVARCCGGLSDIGIDVVC